MESESSEQGERKGGCRGGKGGISLGGGISYFSTTTYPPHMGGSALMEFIWPPMGAVGYMMF